MSKALFIISIASVAMLVGCQDTPDLLSPSEQLEKDIQIIEQYLEENNINAQIDPRQNVVYYVVHEEGNGQVFPEISDEITVSYRGRVLGSEQIFDQSDNLTFPLGNLIPGWQIGLQLMNEGDSVTLYIPSGYAYGPRGTGRIGPNANLEFDIKLLDITGK